jgi:hypothetical protein
LWGRATLKNVQVCSGATSPAWKIGHTVPVVDTLEKLARAFEVPLYQLFYEGGKVPELPTLLKNKPSDEDASAVQERMRGI